MISKLAQIDPNAQLGKNVTVESFTTIYSDVVIGEGTHIGPNVTIYPGARIGKNCQIFPGTVIAAVPQDLKFAGEYTTAEIGDNTIIRECVTIHRGTSDMLKTTVGSNCLLMGYVHVAHDCQIGNHVIMANYSGLSGHNVIGDNVIIHAGTIIGADAFYYKKRPEGFDPLQSSGRVLIEDDVHIGAACTIDKGVSGDTTIKKGAKLDNQVHIGHDSVIGKDCLIASQVGVAGCVNIEDGVTIWGQAGITSAITIGAGSIISAQSGVSKSLEGGKSYFGTPAEEFRKKYKELAALRQLPEVVEQLKKK